MRRMGRLDNFGIHRVERLDGNIGYLDLRRVPVPAIAGPAMAAAMELVAGTYALIIDLRRNGGGAPDGVVFWCSYLFGDQPTHLNDIFRADTGETRQFWALPYVPGPRYLDRPVSVLTSDRTFSGGEDFAYTLQALGRAEVIGETTGGGAHPTRVFPISAAVHIAVPFARSVNPVTGTNWQGTGVVPTSPFRRPRPSASRTRRRCGTCWPSRTCPRRSRTRPARRSTGCRPPSDQGRLIHLPPARSV
jgi:C-terminal processing protease CtpA/Prc